MSSEETRNIGQCHACNGTVSKKARACPHCGQKNPFRKTKKPSSRTSSSRFLWYVGGFIVVFMIIGSLQDPSSRHSQSQGAYGDTESVNLCDSAIRASVNNPSTLTIHRFSGFATRTDASNTRYNTQMFSAKNSFGLKKTFTAYCTIAPDGELLDFKVVEEGS